MLRAAAVAAVTSVAKHCFWPRASAYYAVKDSGPPVRPAAWDAFLAEPPLWAGAIACHKTFMVEKQGGDSKHRGCKFRGLIWQQSVQWSESSCHLPEVPPHMCRNLEGVPHAAHAGMIDASCVSPAPNCPRTDARAMSWHSNFTDKSHTLFRRSNSVMLRHADDFGSSSKGRHYGCDSCNCDAC